MAADFWSSNHWKWLTSKAHLKDAHQEDYAAGLSEQNIQDMKNCMVAYMVDMAKHSQQLIRQRPVGTAVTYMRRFYLSRDMRDHKPTAIATACLYFACKTEETHVPARFFHAPVSSKFPEQWRDWPPCDAAALFDAELVILAELQRNLVVFSPYVSLEISLKEVPSLVDIADGAWGAVNDSYYTDMCLLFPPFVIAAAAILVAAQRTGQVVTDFKALDSLNAHGVADACRVLLRQYSRPLISPEAFQRLVLLVEPS